ncbi:MAG: DUF4416 family protein [bacterium]
MSKPRPPEPAKLFVSAIYADREMLDRCLEKMTERFGPADFSTRELAFDVTGYYQKEMGDKLERRFFAFQELVDPGLLADVKLFTNSLEDSCRQGESRTVNLDPGMLSLHNLVLATGKPVAHRPYLMKGIYADLTLRFENGTFRSLPWTYPDYAEKGMIEFLNRIRKSYKNDLREWREKTKTT